MGTGRAIRLLPSLLALALLAAAVCTFCDAVHVYSAALSYPDSYSAALSYPDSVWFGQAIWVFPLFFVVFFILALTYLSLAKVLTGGLQLTISTRKGSLRALAESMSMFVMTYLLTGFASGSPVFLAGILYSIFLIRLCFTYERRFMLLLAVLLAVGGMMVEGFLGAMGWVAYGEQQVFYVPWWLGGFMHMVLLLCVRVCARWSYRRNDRLSCYDPWSNSSLIRISPKVYA